MFPAKKLLDAGRVSQSTILNNNLKLKEERVKNNGKVLELASDLHHRRFDWVVFQPSILILCN